MLLSPNLSVSGTGVLAVTRLGTTVIRTLSLLEYRETVVCHNPDVGRKSVLCVYCTLGPTPKNGDHQQTEPICYRVGRTILNKCDKITILS